jgi:TIR domain
MMSNSKKINEIIPAASDLFLSYNHVDREAVLAVKQRLEERGVSTFLGSDNLPLGFPWVIALYNAIQEVRAVAVFIGKAGLGNWQMREMSLSFDRQVREEKSSCRFPVIPVLLPGANLKEKSGFLLLNTWVDLRNGLDAEAALDALARAVTVSRGGRALNAEGESLINVSST